MRILAVEDEPEYLEMLQEVMKEIGHTIIVASNGNDALKVLQEQNIDVIISDVRMPVMDGIEFHERVRGIERYKSTPFIFLTGIDDISKVRDASRGESDLLLQKPFPVDSLIRLFTGRARPAGSAAS